MKDPWRVALALDFVRRAAMRAGPVPVHAKTQLDVIM